MVGLNDDASKVLPSKFVKEGANVLLIGETNGEFGGSLYIKELYGETVGKLPDFDYSAELRLWQLVIDGNKAGLINSAKDVNLGGVAIALSKMSALSGMGIEANMEVNSARDIFDESQSRAIIEVDDDKLQEFVELATNLGLSVSKLGKVGGDRVSINDVELSLDRVEDIYFNTFRKTIEQDL
jgi:phosphoribosylformylglycinamidine synthase